MSKVIKGGTIVTADRRWKADVLIEAEGILRIKHFTRVTLQEAGYRKVLEGRTTLEEVKRVIAAE